MSQQTAKIWEWGFKALIALCVTAGGWLWMQHDKRISENARVNVQQDNRLIAVEIDAKHSNEKLDKLIATTEEIAKSLAPLQDNAIRKNQELIIELLREKK